jgi:uncharacterized protein
MKKLYILSVLLLIILFCNKRESLTSNLFPKPSGYVNDFANIIDDSSEQIISNLCKYIKDNKLAEICVCTIDSIPLIKEEYRNPLVYATDLFNNWGIGDKSNNGLLIFISRKDRKATICNGYFTEHVLSDSTSGRILDKTMIPYFKNGNYGIGIIEGIKVIEFEIEKNLRLMYPDKYK